MTRLRIIILISSLFIVQTNYAQILSKKDFVNTEWFTDNTDNIFYKTDTISFIKYSNLLASGKGYNMYYESEGFGDSESVLFQFNRHGNMNLWVIYYHISTKARLKERKWKIDKESNELVIIINGETEFCLKPIAKREIEFKVRNETYKTIEITMIKKQLLLTKNIVHFADSVKNEYNSNNKK